MHAWQETFHRKVANDKHNANEKAGKVAIIPRCMKSYKIERARETTRTRVNAEGKKQREERKGKSPYHTDKQ